MDLSESRPGVNNGSTSHPSNQTANLSTNNQILHLGGTQSGTCNSTAQAQNPLDPAVMLEFRRRIDETGKSCTLTHEDKQHSAWLHEAINLSDFFTIFLHQLMCLRVHNADLLGSKFGFSRRQALGWRVLEQLSGACSKVSPSLLKLWATAPYSLNTSATIPILSVWVDRIKTFLSTLSEKWIPLRLLCLQRRFPPTAYEIIEKLSCPPFLGLCKLFYWSLELQINLPSSKAWGDRSMGLFSINFHAYTQMLKNTHGQPVQHDAAWWMIERFGREYLKALADHRHQQQTISQVQPNPAVTSNQPRQTFTDHTNPTHHFTLNHPVQSQAAQPPYATRQPTQPISPPNTSSTDIAEWRFVPLEYPSAAQRMQIQRQLQMAAQRAHASPTFRPPNFIPQLNQIGGVLNDPNPLRMALHQAHVWQPVTHVKEPPEGPPITRLYQFVASTLVQPRKLDVEECCYFAQPFNVSEDLYSRAAKTKFPGDTEIKRPSRTVDHGTIVIHLRCICAGTAQSADISQSTWAAAPTYWPQHCFISLNDKALELRRKRHHKKDLAVDITDLVHQGENEFKVSLHEAPEDKGKTFLLAVEILEMSDETHTLALPSTISYADSLACITKSMKPAQTDEDLTLIDSNISIDLADPFTARLFETPVRGKDCKHRECFDLKAYLHSRTSDQKDELTSPYEWNCPLCRADARPASLVIDGFLVEVRKQLVEQGKLDVKAILVSEDGSWKAKIETEAKKVGRESQQDDVKGGTVSCSEVCSANQNVERVLTKDASRDGMRSTYVEVIEIEDD